MNEPDFKAKLTLLMKIHLALAGSPLIYGATVIWLNLTDPPGELTEANGLLLYIPPVLTLIALPLSPILFRQQLGKNLQPSMMLDRKIAVFQTSHLVRMAPLVAAGLAAAVVSFQTANNYNLIIIGILLIIIGSKTPFPGRISTDLSLSNSEKQTLINAQHKA